MISDPHVKSPEQEGGKPLSSSDYRAKYYKERMLSEQLSKRVTELDNHVAKLQQEGQSLKDKLDEYQKRVHDMASELHGSETLLQDMYNSRKTEREQLELSLNK